jgi:hypothetical protein
MPFGSKEEIVLDPPLEEVRALRMEGRPTHILTTGKCTETSCSFVRRKQLRTSQAGRARNQSLHEITSEAILLPELPYMRIPPANGPKIIMRESRWDAAP